MPSAAFDSHPAPVLDYAAAMARIQAKQAGEAATPGFDPGLKTILLTHGKRSRRAVLWLHGYCVAPPHFKALAEACFQQGCNVLVPCAPHHGFKDRMTSEVSQLNALELVRYTDEMIDLVHGLGEEVIVGGLSMGGTLTAWAAHERADVSRAIILAPFLGGRVIPTPLTWIVLAAMRLVPDIRIWWDPQKKEACDGEPYGYPRYSTRSLGQLGLLAGRVLNIARQRPPAAGNVWVVLNEHDESVNNELVQQLADTWVRSGATNVQLYRFLDEIGLPHDCISQSKRGGNTALVYAEIMKMIG